MKDSNISFNKKNVNVQKGLLSGFIASAVSSVVLVLLTSLVVIPDFNYIAIQGSLFGITGAALSAWAVYFILGTFIWGLLYAFLEPHLAGQRGSSKGILYGFLVWIAVMLIFMPFTEAGFFLKQYSVSAAGIILVTDLIFGATLGYFYEKLR